MFTPTIVSNYAPTKLHSNAKCLKFISQTYQCKQITLRITPTSRILIDHFYKNESAKITSHGVVHVGISDHSLIFAVRKFNTLKATPKILKTKNVNPDAFIEDMKNTPFYWYQQ